MRGINTTGSCAGPIDTSSLSKFREFVSGMIEDKYDKFSFRSSGNPVAFLLIEAGEEKLTCYIFFRGAISDHETLRALKQAKYRW